MKRSNPRTTSSGHAVYVRFVDGTVGMVPLAVRENEDGTVTLLANAEFDPEDSSTLFEFLPGDAVRTKSTAVLADGKPESVRVATELVRSSAHDRGYWYVLFSVASEEQTHLDLPADQLHAIARRICAETDSETRWHYPNVVAWARKVASA